MTVDMHTTERGFLIGTFKDSYGIECSIQESSNVDAALWLGCQDADPRYLIPATDEACGEWAKVEMPDEYVADTRMHLTQTQVIELLPLLTYFAAYGVLPGGYNK